MSKKLDDFLDNQTIPVPSENARKTALNMATHEFESYQKEKNEKKSQGFLNLPRLMGINTSKDRRPKMKNRKLIYGSMATAMVVVLAGGAAVYQTRTHELVSGADMATNIIGAPATTEITPSYQDAIVDYNQIAETEMAATGESFIPVPTGRATNTGIAILNDEIQEEPLERWRMQQPESQIAKKEMLSQNAPIASSRAAPESLAENNFIASDLVAPFPPPSMPVDPMPPQLQDNDKFQDHEISAVKQVTQEPVSTFSIDVDTASYSFVRRQLENGILPNPDAVRIEEMINYFPYAYKGPETAETPFNANISVVDSPWKAGNKLIHIGLKGYDLEPDVQPRANLVFLLDVSGSMNQPDKLPLLKNSFKLLLNTLHPEDTVGIVVYAGAAGTVLEPTKVAQKQKILNALESLSAGGSTAGAAGIQGAYALAEQNFDKDAVNRVILATDGDFNVGASSNDELKTLIEEKRKSGIFLSVFGFGQGNLNDHLMQTLAQNGNGIAAHIDSLAEAQKVLVDEATSSLFPIAKDVKVQVEFNPEVVSEYRLIGYETRALNREDFNNDKVDAGDIGAGHTVTAIYEITQKGSGNELYGESRYHKTEDVQARTDFGSEYAYLKMRYKLPNEDSSNLITVPITTENVRDLDSETAFALSVAGFGQLLKNDKYVSGDFSYDNVLELAQKGKGEDTYGYRAEFIRLVRLAQSIDN